MTAKIFQQRKKNKTCMGEELKYNKELWRAAQMTHQRNNGGSWFLREG
tara:strand:- start:67 stop:210 length:144 start_codon:yes stop_codon:yes gene_type:complete